ncbi:MULTISPECIES: ABC transporter permease [Lachnospiraceae]|uniref:ABC transporter permease n=1 Tax=Lachnospiraceae TaxID=186803 RepID=UPI0006735340|nr:MULTISPECIES: ABC transporter permease [Lachnospiraceae]KMZ53312.1 ribose ABC transporter, permease protein [Dorea sp. D27]MCB6200661.1 ABC transporter permease [Extibacter muris]MCQ4663626.1 ABC transporter permease [Extibacter muris]MCQ4692159.1 ABC transporter permease [Extibacter muris]
MKNLSRGITGRIGKFGTLLVLLLIIVILSIAEPNFLSLKNFTNIMRQVSVTGIISFGMTMVIITGGIDLSPGSTLAFAGMVIAIFASAGNNIAAALSGIGIALLCGVINGGVIAVTGIPPFIMTLGMQLMARGAANIVTGGFPITNLNDTFRQIGGGSVGIIPIPIIIYAVLAVLSHLILAKTAFGKSVYAIGGNKEAAHLCGINVKLITFLVYAYMGIMTGIAAIILTSRVNAGNASVGVNYEFDAIIATVIGGTSLAGGIGTIFGCIIGALVVGCIDSGLTMLGVSAFYQQIFKGALIIVSVILDTYRSKAVKIRK